MSMNLGTKAACWMLAAAAGAISFAPAAQATAITYDFTVDVTSGPLTGNVSSGTFSYDSSSITPGGHNLAAGLLTALDFTFNGTTYNAGTANTGALEFDASGNLTFFAFGNNCAAGTCTVTGGTDQWFVTPGPSGFIYSTPTSNQGFSGDVTYALSSASVPEPGTLGLFGLGLLLLGVAAWRRPLTLRRYG